MSGIMMPKLTFDGIMPLYSPVIFLVTTGTGDLSICLHPQGQIDFSNAAPDLTPVMAERLFERFFTVETARHSTGLGLFPEISLHSRSISIHCSSSSTQ